MPPRQKQTDDAPAVSPTNVDPAPDVDAPPTTTAAGGTTYVVEYAGLEDGPVTFTRPGIESHTFDLKGGRITTTKERAVWLLRHTAANPVAEKE